MQKVIMYEPGTEVKSKGIALFAKEVTAYVHSYIIVDESNIKDYRPAIQDYFKNNNYKPFLMVFLVSRRYHVERSVSLACPYPADWITLNEDEAVRVNIKVAQQFGNWSDFPHVNMTFANRSKAGEFAQALADYSNSQVRLGYEDFSGKCDDNGNYFSPKQKAEHKPIAP